MYFSAVFALRVVLAGRAVLTGQCLLDSAYWTVLACAPYIGAPEITEIFLGIFLRCWAAVKGGRLTPGAHAKGCLKHLWTPFGLSVKQNFGRF